MDNKEQEPSAVEKPHKLPSTPEKRRILGEFYDRFNRQQWFYRAEYVENHPNHMKDTLVIHCKYNPVLEMKPILEFTSKYQVALEIVAFSHQG